MESLKKYVKAKEPDMKPFEFAKTMVNYSYLVKERYINNLAFVYNDPNLEPEHININKFD